MAKYVVSDLHGMKALYDQIAAFIKPEDTVYCLGDCGDRGPQSWATLKAVLTNPQFTLLMGNHEHLLLEAMTNGGSYKDDPVSLLYYNGGASTYEDWQAEPHPEAWVSAVKRLPFYLMVKNDAGTIIHLTHAGFTPPTVPNNFDLVWSREHFGDQWPDECDNEIVIHGHTPTPYLVKKFNSINKRQGKPEQKWEPGAIYYAGTHKIDIDCGSFSTGYTVLLDLDTFDEHIFQCEVDEDV